MKRIKILSGLALILCAFFFLKSGAAHAYVTTGAEAFSADGKTGIYLIEYAFGHENHAIHMPLAARQTSERHEKTLSYAFYDDAGNRADGSTAAIVLSNTGIKDNEYIIPEGQQATFWLLAFFTPELGQSGEYRLQVEHLPFSFDGTKTLQLNPSELEYYTTELLELGN